MRGSGRVSGTTGTRPTVEGANEMICRSNRCGLYDKATDACREVIRLGDIKGERRPGKVTWLINHPDAKCVADPPMWTNDDDDGSNSDGLESRED